VPADHHVATLTVPAEARYIGICRAALSGALAGAGFDDDVVQELKVVLSEVCANTVRHAYPGETGMIEVEFRTAADEIEVRVDDTGVGLPRREDLRDGFGLSALRTLTTRWQMGGGDGGRGTRVTFARTRA
jgi:serine/threonine-protein kinase RsbW